MSLKELRWGLGLCGCAIVLVAVIATFNTIKVDHKDAETIKAIITVTAANADSLISISKISYKPEIWETYYFDSTRRVRTKKYLIHGTNIFTVNP